jgi:mannosyltransferase OCH1-like enzyme
MIPKILHQIWVGPKPIPQDNINSWLNFHPDWEYYLWTEDTIVDRGLNLHNRYHYNSYYNDKCFNGAANILRLEVLYNYGGVYVDMDSICLNSLNSLENLNDDFFGVYSPNIKGRVGNAFIGSTKHSPIIKHYMDQIHNLKKINPSWKTTGGGLLTNIVKEYDIKNKILPSTLFYSHTKEGKWLNPSTIRYSTHYWGTTFNKY